MQIGTLFLSQQIIQGTTSKGVPYYRFQAFRLPEQYKVACRRRGSRPVRALIDANHQLIEILGEVGDPPTEYQTLRYFHQLRYPPQIIPTGYPPVHSPPSTFIPPSFTRECYTLDPPNCLDPDDAYSYCLTTGEIWIHIAHPLIDLEHLVHPPWSSLYLPNRMIPMLKSYEHYALLPHKTRLVITFHFRHSDHRPEVSLNSIVVTQKLTYGQICPQVSEFLELSRIYHPFLQDDHDLIEYWMVRVNQAVAQQFSPIIYRAHQDPDHDLNKDRVNLAPELKSFLTILESKTAYYTDQPQVHNWFRGLYSHSTSPIRRRIDLINHYLIHSQLLGHPINKLNLIDICEQANIFQHRLQKLERDIRRFQLIDQLRSIPELIVSGYLMSIDRFRGKIYLPQYKLTQSFDFVPVSFQSLVEMLSQTPQEVHLRVKETGRELHLHLYQLFQVKILANPESVYHQIMVSLPGFNLLE